MQLFKAREGGWISYQGRDVHIEVGDLAVEGSWPLELAGDLFEPAGPAGIEIAAADPSGTLTIDGGTP